MPYTPPAIPTYALTTLARVKNRLGIADAVTTFDLVLSRLIMAYTSSIESACSDRRFATSGHTNEVHNIEPGQTVVYLRHWDVTAISSAQFNYGTPGTPAWSDFVQDNYALMDEGRLGRVRLFMGLQGINAVRFSYTAGYLVDFATEFDATKHTLPYEITDLCERLVIAAYNKRTDEGKADQSAGDIRVQWNKEPLSDSDKILLAPYQRPHFA